MLSPLLEPRLQVSTNQYADPKLAAPACGSPFSINPGFTTRLTARMVGAPWTNIVLRRAGAAAGVSSLAAPSC